MSLNNYRPVMTARYTLDWLNAFKLKDINELKQSELNQEHSMLETASFVNYAMRQVMHGKSAIWGVKENQTERFIGIISLQNIDLVGKAAQLFASFLPSDLDQTDTLTEVVPHVIGMLQTDFNFKYLFVSQSQVAIFLPALLQSKFEKVESTKDAALVEFIKTI
ncbi:hypothetical protein [Ligilactobacillus pobuzihii]|uniref:Uncharacterized protein n=1 Tax=Ligilactobacillus pobuzihii TaxID=449659 RepID=A0A0R2LDJ9_9LACO|nr:hypothetical protein [Ligilactobacillus pobuzihii]KRK09297.1 hypothetical protein FD11_GL001047 [Ligilactobacillus pobuzihii E100301 = KCTC 13174]KRN99961.1 hypothetical protein IV66_GL001388 [Ligilactobacillus pobuzihii]GEN48762.1 hypothetical protein LPO01_15540 [Ligilactobacillus pobuzihii]